MLTPFAGGQELDLNIDEQRPPKPKLKVKKVAQTLVTPKKEGLTGSGFYKPSINNYFLQPNFGTALHSPSYSANPRCSTPTGKGADFFWTQKHQRNSSTEAERLVEAVEAELHQSLESAKKDLFVIQNETIRNIRKETLKHPEFLGEDTVT